MLLPLLSLQVLPTHLYLCVYPSSPTPPTLSPSLPPITFFPPPFHATRGEKSPCTLLSLALDLALPVSANIWPAGCSPDRFLRLLTAEVLVFPFGTVYFWFIGLVIVFVLMCSLWCLCGALMCGICSFSLRLCVELLCSLLHLLGSYFF